MARIRYLKPDFFKDEDIKELPFEARLFYQGLWCISDREGRGEDRPERLKVEIFPYEDMDIEKLMCLLAKPKKHSKRPFINRYETDGHRYYEITEWKKHQKPHHTEKSSTIPPFNGYLTVKTPLDNSNLRDEHSPSPLSSSSPLSYFYSKYEKTCNRPYAVAPGKDYQVFADLALTHKEDEIKTLIDRFFASKDKFIVEAGRTIGVFKSQINKLQAGQVEPKTRITA